MVASGHETSSSDQRNSSKRKAVMKIIEQPRAPNPRRVKIFVAEKGLDIPFEPIELNKGEHRSEAFTALNPLQRVPVLVLDDGTAISESVAICRYLEELHPEPALFGRTPLEKAMVEMWNRRMDLGLLFHVSQCFRHKHPAMAALEVPQIAEWGDANAPRAMAQLQVLDGALATQPFVAGDAYSIADITAMVAIDFMKPAKLEVPEALVNVQRWYRDVAARPSSQLK
jgi:glutathione S-transferase